MSRLRRIVDRIRDPAIVRRDDSGSLRAIALHEPGLTALDADALHAEALHLRERPADVPLAFAVVRECARRATGMRLYDVQLAGGLAMLDGLVAEMATGEGKTLAAVAPACVLALAGRGVHVLTANDYLARRDASWMGPVYDLLGMTAACVQQQQTAGDRRAAYSADVTYATANEAGFDYLRDRLATSPDEVVQRDLYAVIVDEVDSILIDEARVPLVVAGGRAPPDEWAAPAFETARRLRDGVHYHVDYDRRAVQLTPEGQEAAGGPDELLVAVHLALEARTLRRDVDYIIRAGRVELIDEFKGRVAQTRRYADGLQTAVEIKEGLDPSTEGRILSTITMQSFVRLYERRCGMTGTAATSADELRSMYGMRVAVVPHNRPCVRVDHPDVTFATLRDKERALVEEIARVHATGRPILVGTGSVAESDRLATALRGAGIDCVVLNARNDESEAAIVAEAGRIGAVTISTNMAGRGTDIRLGGSSHDEHQRVVDLGGLYVIGTNRHDARRIDMQLRGRAGRQGDPGESRFFVSLEDDLVVRYGIDDLLGDEPDIERAQRVVDFVNTHARENLARYAWVLERQRERVHSLRQDVLFERREVSGDLPPVLWRVDALWADHIATMRELHDLFTDPLYGVANPFGAYQRRSAARFEALVEALRAATDGQGAGPDPGEERPTATWTYLMDDTPLRSKLYSEREVVASMLREGFRGRAR